MQIETRALFVFLFVGLFVGLVAGFLASRFLGSNVGALRFVVAGVIGSFVGGSLFEALNIDVGVKNRLFLEAATAAIGAIIVVIPAQFLV